MKTCSNIQAADAKEMRRQGESAFTMIEIAIAIGVIGFALVAIIGILPAGMNSQKDNREDTVISQDAPYFLEAIRNGAVVSNGLLVTPNNYLPAQGLDFLTNYVQSIRFDNYLPDGKTNTFIYSNFYSGAEIIGLLTTPQNNYNSPLFTTNYFDVTATVRALSGPATAQNGLNNIMAFTYQMEVMVTPFNSFAPDTINYSNYLSSSDPNQWIIRSNRWLEATPGAQINGTNIPGAGALLYNLFEVRLRFSWPVLANGKVGPGRQTYRTLIASQMAEAPMTINGVSGVPCWFFQPQTYTNIFPTGL